MATKTLLSSASSIDASKLSKLLTESGKSSEAFVASLDTILEETYSKAIQADDAIVSGRWAKLYGELGSLRREAIALNQDKSQTIATAIMKFSHIR
jgi:hypothetical protein